MRLVIPLQTPEIICLKRLPSTNPLPTELIILVEFRPEEFATASSTLTILVPYHYSYYYYVKFVNCYQDFNYLFGLQSWIEAQAIAQPKSPPAFLTITNELQTVRGVNFAGFGAGILNTTVSSIYIYMNVPNIYDIGVVILVVDW